MVGPSPSILITAGYWAGFKPALCTLSKEQELGRTRVDLLVACGIIIGGAHSISWSQQLASLSCRKSSVAWTYLSSPHVLSPLLLLLMWPSQLVKSRIPFESSVVAWWELLGLSWHASCLERRSNATHLQNLYIEQGFLDPLVDCLRL